ncbi:MAG: hypothetical protein H7281_04055 [Bacteriovorax sp.]|nr:hypothetical protein [Bacteriovorax sp.]
MKFLLLMLLSLSAANASSTYNVHEWGTFTSLVGSDGTRQEGMFHEDEVLPSFVHNFGEQLPRLGLMAFATLPTFPPLQRLLPTPTPTPTPPPHRNCGQHSKVGCDFLEGQSITQKMETPVLYFHSDVPLRVTVDVGFPTGIISQTYPAPVLSRPLANPGVSLTSGFARFNVEVLTKTELMPPVVERGNIYAHARAVDANTIKSNNEVEKFIFYRGLGKFETKLLITSHNGNISVKNNTLNISKNFIPRAFLVDTNEFGGAILSIGSFVGGKIKHISDKDIQSLKNHHQEFSIFAASAKALLTKSLVSEGLNLDEALAMVNTWEHGYFRTPGLRVLYILNRDEVENILPMTITPAPQVLNRVFVGRIEVLRDVEENQILAQILLEKESFNVMSLGRFAPSIISRVYQVAKERGLVDFKLQSLFDQFNFSIAENM